MLWSSWEYVPTGYSEGDEECTTFTGILNNPNGPIVNFSKTLSTDTVDKPFRRQMHDMINGDNNGIYDAADDENIFKTINFNYSTGNESILSFQVFSILGWINH